MNASRLLKPLSIGGVTLKNNIILAPMAGYGDVAFRRLCRDFGAGLTVTEMISVNGLNYGNEKTGELLARAENETPCAVQLFGSSPDAFYRALKECRALDGFEIIDVNMGCPVPKVTKQGAGSALMLNKELAAEIVDACKRGGGGRPVTVKFRLGVGEDEFTAESFADKMRGAGAAALTVHGRTARQMYRGKADWNKIALVKKAAGDIPVFGNGDVTSFTDFELAIEGSGVDGVAVGRGALGHPQLFAEVTGGEVPDSYAALMRHVDYMAEYFPESYAVIALRKHLVYYLKGIPNMKQAKQEVNTAPSLAALRTALKTAFGRGG